MARDLDDLFAYLDALQGRAPLDELKNVLARCEVEIEDVARFVRFSERCYQRIPLRGGDWFQAWVMCWRNGQRSPIHDHAASACAVCILDGTATVTRFERAANGHIKAVASEDFPPGTVVASQDADVHQVSNLMARGDLVTLHTYTPPLLRMGTYSILDATRSVDVWSEWIEDAGI